MPSTNKTSQLGLNQWQSSDKPKMSDFNADNLLIDNAIKAHIQDDDLHLTETEKAYISSPVVTGSYTGDGANSKVITLGYRPKHVIVFMHGYPLMRWDDGNSSNLVYCGMASDEYSTTGIQITDTGFTVYHTSGWVSDFPASRLNTEDAVFAYTVFK